MIKIGVSSCFLYPDKTRKYFSPKTLCFMESDMANYLYRENVMPILIPDLEGKSLESMLSQMDGFVLQGGSDVCPSSYGEAHLDLDRWPGDKQRDLYELKIIDYAFTHRKPVFGICRGAQLLNVFFGGTLYQDLQTQFSDKLKHYQREEYDKNYHSVEFSSDGQLSKLYQHTPPLYVNSVHHQGIKSLGRDLIIEAIAPADNLVEAFSYKNMDDNFALGVQWHPEFSHSIADKTIPAEPIYEYFINAVNTKRGK